MIDVTGVDLVKLVQNVYSLSGPQGMGFLHFREGELTTQQAQALIWPGDLYPVEMDYVHGRACKFRVMEKDDKLYTDAAWYDHTEDQLVALLKSVGIENAEPVDPFALEAKS